MRRKKGLIIDPSDICYEEECEEIGFEAPGEIISERPEYDDLEKIAKDTGLALRKVKEMIR